MSRGNCAGDENPDYWYPEIPIGRPSATMVRKLADQTNYALKLCSTCPIKDECLAEGMKTEQMRGDVFGWGNLPFGIWGGTMPYERLAMAGISPRTSAGLAVTAAYRLKSVLESLLIRR